MITLFDIRIHTRSIVYEPSVFTKKMIDLLSKYNVRLVFHINYPYELDDVVEKKINEIRQSGIRMYSSSICLIFILLSDIKAVSEAEKNPDPINKIINKNG